MVEPFYQDSHVTIYHGDCREVLPQLPANSIQCCVSSPPYYGLRDYGGGAWVGGDEGCDHVDPYGPVNAPSVKSTLTTNNGKGPQPGDKYHHDQKAQYRDICGKCSANRQSQQIGLEPTPAAYVAEMTSVFEEVRRVLRQDGVMFLNLGDSYGAGKQMLGVPWKVAFALQDRSWILRSDIIWSKGNPMPESVTDRPTKSHEYLFLLAKAEKYFYDADAIREPHVRDFTGDHKTGAVDHLTGLNRNGSSQDGLARAIPNPNGRNRRSVWNVNTQPYAGAHFAVFPEKLIEPCILAGCPEGGIVLDPFGGSGTTARVAKRLGRKAILIEQNEAYCDMAAASLAQNVFDLVTS